MKARGSENFRSMQLSSDSIEWGVYHPNGSPVMPNGDLCHATSDRHRAKFLSEIVESKRYACGLWLDHWEPNGIHWFDRWDSVDYSKLLKCARGQVDRKTGIQHPLCRDQSLYARDFFDHEANINELGYYTNKQAAERVHKAMREGNIFIGPNWQRMLRPLPEPLFSTGYGHTKRFFW